MNASAPKILIRFSGLHYGIAIRIVKGPMIGL